MDNVDKKILNLLQTDFPVTEEPYKEIGEKIGLDEDEVLRRVKALKDEKIIRRIGAIFDLRKLGYASTLCAARVPEDRIDKFVQIVNGYAGVTHNYRRNHEYNFWFTFIAPSEDDLQASIEEIKEKTGVHDILSMRAVRTFKIDATFDV